jgi:hypothetical protein
MPRKISRNFFVAGVYSETVMFNAFDANLCIIHVFIKQIFRATSHSYTVQGVWKYWLFIVQSREFGYGFEAVRIGVKTNTTYIIENANRVEPDDLCPAHRCLMG